MPPPGVGSGAARRGRGSTDVQGGENGKCGQPISYVLVIISVTWPSAGSCACGAYEHREERTEMGALELLKQPATFFKEILTNWIVLLGCSSS